MTLPTNYDERKALPLWDFMFGYFPKAWLAVVDVAVAGDKQHKNTGKTITWARDKSTDQLNTAFRHQFDYGLGVKKDTDGQWHLAKAIWRLSAQLQLDIEAEQERMKLGVSNQLSGCVDAMPGEKQHPTGCTCGVCWVARADAERKYGKVVHSPATENVQKIPC